MGIAFAKGHGTGNDFVLLPDPGAELELSDAAVAALCDRRFGIGGDGVLRVVPSAAMDLPPTMTGSSEWFMDYRNADGSIAEMCGNGARVFARFLVSAGLAAPGEFEIGTRGGARLARVPAEGAVGVDMGQVTIPGTAGVTVTLRGDSWPGTAAFAPNPHAVAFVADPAALGEIESSAAGPAGVFPDGVNVEFVSVLAPDRVVMRVNERGVGETMSCGTGACAVAAVHRRLHGVSAPEITVVVPGGEVIVTERDDGDTALTGPAVIVARGEIPAHWWGSLQ